MRSEKTPTCSTDAEPHAHEAMRHPKIYVVTEEPFHDNSAMRFATLDIDQAFVVAEGIVAAAREEGVIAEFDIQIYELDGTAGVARAWMTTHCDPEDDPHNVYGKWFQFMGGDDYRRRAQYEHVPGGRKERLLEAAEIIMMMAVEGDE